MKSLLLFYRYPQKVLPEKGHSLTRKNPSNILESKMILIDGKKAAAELREELKQEV